jgi:integrase
MAKKSKMRDGLIERGRGRWTAVFHLGYSDPDPITGRRRILQKSISLGKCSSRSEAKARRDELAVSIRHGDFVQPSKQGVGEWLRTWFDESVRSARRPRTVVTYRTVIRKHLTPALGSIQLQSLRPGQITAYYAAKIAEGYSSRTLQQHHAVLNVALASAVKQGVVTKNVAALVDAKPRGRANRDEAKKHCWTADEARAFLIAAQKSGTQDAALFAFGLDTGARQGEILATRWADLDLDAGTVVVDRTLLSRNGDPEYGPTKTGKTRTIDLNTATVALLRQHKATQAELKMANRTTYRDHGLTFAREWRDVQKRTQVLGQPLTPDGFTRAMKRIIEAAGVRRIKPHGLRHTMATLLLTNGEALHVVSTRLGHANPTMTLEAYAHVLPSHGRAAAATLGRLLHGNG